MDDSKFEDEILFKKLDQIIKDNGGYSKKSQTGKNDIIEKQINFKEAIASFNKIIARTNKSSPLLRSEYLAAEHFRKGMNTLFLDNISLRSFYVAEKIVNICKEEAAKTSGHAKLLLLDTINECLNDSGITLSIRDKNELSKQQPIYKYIKLDSLEVPALGLHDRQINNILIPLIKITEEEDLTDNIGSNLAKELKLHVNNLNKNLSGKNTLNDDYKICYRLDKLASFIDENINSDKENKTLKKIKLSVIEVKKFINRFPFDESKPHLNESKFDVNENIYDLDEVNINKLEKINLLSDNILNFNDMINLQNSPKELEDLLKDINKEIEVAIAKKNELIKFIEKQKQLQMDNITNDKIYKMKDTINHTEVKKIKTKKFLLSKKDKIATQNQSIDEIKFVDNIE